MNIKPTILSAIIYLLSLLPFWALYILSDILCFILYHIVKYRRKIVEENIANSFPDKSQKERKGLERKFYPFLGDLIVENIKMRTMSASQSKKRLKLLNPEIPLGYLANNQSVILVSSHYANWEWGIHSLSIMTDKPSLIIYKPLSDKTFGEIYNKMRSRFGATMVPMKQTLRKIIEYKNRVHTSVFLADQTPSRSETNYFIPFLNQETLVFKGIERIAVKTNYPVIYCHIDRVKRGYYNARFTTLIEEPANYAKNEITKIHTQFLERIIQEKPELWLWSHKRWKHKPHD